MQPILNSIRAQYLPKRKEYLLRLKPEMLHQAIDVFPISSGLWDSASFIRLQFDFTNFELSPVGGAASTSHFTPNLLGRLEQTEENKILMTVTTSMPINWYFCIGAIFLFGISLSIHSLLESQLSSPWWAFILVLFVIPGGLLFYKHNAEKVVIRRFEKELTDNLKRQGTIHASLEELEQ
jgi:hypothetical protein